MNGSITDVFLKPGGSETCQTTESALKGISLLKFYAMVKSRNEIESPVMKEKNQSILFAGPSN